MADRRVLVRGVLRGVQTEVRGARRHVVVEVGATAAFHDDQVNADGRHPVDQYPVLAPDLHGDARVLRPGGHLRREAVLAARRPGEREVTGVATGREGRIVPAVDLEAVGIPIGLAGRVHHGRPYRRPQREGGDDRAGDHHERQETDQQTMMMGRVLPQRERHETGPSRLRVRGALAHGAPGPGPISSAGKKAPRGKNRQKTRGIRWG